MIKWLIQSHKLVRSACLLSCFSRLWLCAPWTVYCQPGSSVHEIIQARILEWVAVPSSRGSSRPRDQTHVSCGSCIKGRFFITEPLEQIKIQIQAAFLLYIQLLQFSVPGWSRGRKVKAHSTVPADDSCPNKRILFELLGPLGRAFQMRLGLFNQHPGEEGWPSQSLACCFWLRKHSEVCFLLSWVTKSSESVTRKTFYFVFSFPYPGVS